MASAHDVAKYILTRQGEMTTWKLQKLVYYSKAWHLVWDGESLFDERIEAWANGPVVRDLYRVHRKQYRRKTWPEGKINNLTQDQKESIDAILDFYGDKSGHWLSELTHQEAPWRDAREGLAVGERGNSAITDAALLEYYSGLLSAN
jgi:uncharacterized phage-associated protein